MGLLVRFWESEKKLSILLRNLHIFQVINVLVIICARFIFFFLFFDGWFLRRIDRLLVFIEIYIPLLLEAKNYATMHWLILNGRWWAWGDCNKCDASKSSNKIIYGLKHRHFFSKGHHSKLSFAPLVRSHSAEIVKKFIFLGSSDNL